MTTFKLTEVKADIFQIPQTYSLAFTSTSDFYAERGTLGWQVNLIFGQNDELSRQYITNGNVAVLEDHDRFIYLMVTKENMYYKSTYGDVEAALICLKYHMQNHGVYKVAMPRICCGSDGLQWSQIKQMILRIFANEYNTEIMVCNYHPPKITTPKCRFVEQRGPSVKSSENCSVVHTISADFAMCSGIGLQFNCKNNRVTEQLRQDKHTGNVAVLKDQNRYVYNLVTKERSHERGTYVALFYALIATRDHMRKHNVTKLAIPRLGCGIDRLDWFRVKDMLEMVFAEDDVEIKTFAHEPMVSMASRESLHVHCMACKRAF
ncbi:terminal ADP-ribose protein glycohydrolase 2 [Haematobia irritans]|uniref:terminal ADP-ribose protein glycohydrolase 2 n=1 Tax=Haematobia irritans TaxID=7368 RepID=UPI003F4FBADB